MEILLVLLVGGGILFYLYKRMMTDGNMNSHDAAPHGIPTVPPLPEPQPAPVVNTVVSEPVSLLPPGWDSYSPADKIAYFNKNSITEEQLLSYGVAASDIAWMRDNGYTVGILKPELEPKPEAVKPKKPRAKKVTEKPVPAKKPVAVKPVPVRKPATKKAKK